MECCRFQLLPHNPDLLQQFQCKENPGSLISIAWQRRNPVCGLSEEIRDKNRKLFQEEVIIEKEVWLELFEIFQGNYFKADFYINPSLKGKSYEELMDGKGIINWWD